MSGLAPQNSTSGVAAAVGLGVSLTSNFLIFIVNALAAGKKLDCTSSMLLSAITSGITLPVLGMLVVQIIRIPSSPKPAPEEKTTETVV
jgi:hypothetical protein